MKNYSWKTALCFNKKKSLFNKRALEQSRRAAGGGISPNQNMFGMLTRLTREKHFFFFKKGIFNEASYPPALYLSKIGPVAHNSFSLVLFLILRSTILAEQFLPELTKRWHFIFSKEF